MASPQFISAEAVHYAPREYYVLTDAGKPVFTRYSRCVHICIDILITRGIADPAKKITPT
jgi:hypothetical protein